MMLRLRAPFAILEAPSILGLFPKGVETLPRALLAAGLAERLDARHAGNIVPPPYDPKIDPPSAPSSIAVSFRSCSVATVRFCSAICSH